MQAVVRFMSQFLSLEGRSGAVTRGRMHRPMYENRIVFNVSETNDVDTGELHVQPTHIIGR